MYLTQEPEVCKNARGRAAAFEYKEGDFKVTDEMKQAYQWDGLILIKGLLSPEEVQKINNTLTAENSPIRHKAFEVADGVGTSSRLALWNHPGSDITGMVARCDKVAGTCQQLLGGEVYHYHTKLMMKEARTGGKHLWHQDYGYWYKNGCLRPDMATVFIAIDKCCKENGCVQMLKGTHRCGRIEHDLVHGQTMANLERVEELKKHFELIHAEMDPGDAVIFHCNVLHTSDQNKSDMRRWAFLCAYNRADNDPVMKHHHPNYTPLDIVSNSAIMDCTNTTDFSGKDFMNPKDDHTSKGELAKNGVQ